MAQLVGISTTWYTWIEQERDVDISADALDRLAANLRLTRSERAYLFEIADRRDPHSGQAESDDVPPLLIELLVDVDDPGLPDGALLGHARLERRRRGTVYRLARSAARLRRRRRISCASSSSSRGRGSSSSTGRRAPAASPPSSAPVPQQPRLDPVADAPDRRTDGEQIDFARFWKQHDVLERRGGERYFLHPLRGEIGYQQATRCARTSMST